MRIAGKLSLAALIAAPLLAVGPTTLSAADHQLVPVWPTPQHQAARSDGFAIPRVVGVVAGPGTDHAALQAVRTILTGAGVTQIQVSPDDPGTSMTVWLESEAPALSELGVPGHSGLAAEGYVLAIGQAGRRKHVVLDGVDDAGTFYAAQTLRQLVQANSGAQRLPGVVIRDWPAMRYRGSVEGFYGTPWTHEERLDHFDYLGTHKMNTYIYAPKDDPYHRDRWREPYPADRLAKLAALAQQARSNHVEFTFALSPGLSVCYSSPDDAAALLAKFDAIHAIGGRSFTVAIDDIDYNTWHCPGDPQHFGTGGEGAGKAQSHLLNQVQAWVRGKGDVARLQLVPTEYWGLGDSPYRRAIRDYLDRDIVVHWTGVDVIAPTITNAHAAQAKAVFGHDILVWDNYPVNDYIAGRLPMAAYVGRDRGLSSQVAGVISNPANQAAVSKVSLFSFAEFSWHDSTFDPAKAWQAALAEAAGGDAKTVAALRAFADVNAYDGHIHLAQAPEVAQAIEAFWARWHAGDQAGAVRLLKPRYSGLAAVSGTIRSGVKDPAFIAEAGAWLDATALWAQALSAAVDMLAHQSGGAGAAAWADRQRLDGYVARALAIRDIRQPHAGTAPKIGDGVIDVFLRDAKAAFDRWVGLDAAAAVGSATMDAHADNIASRMVDGDLNTYFWSNRSPNVGDAVGVDLGTVRQIGEVSVLMGKAGSPDDFVHAGVLEYSVDGKSWKTLTSATTPEVHAVAPKDARARYVRYRATADNGGNWCVVREFTVQDTDVVRYSVTGAPEGDNLAAAADRKLDTAYQAGVSPKAGDKLTVTASRVRPTDRVIVVGTGAAAVEARTGGAWRKIGSLREGYTELPTGGQQVEAVRLNWTAGSKAPRIHEIVFRYTDVPAAHIVADPLTVDTGDSGTLRVRLESTQPHDTLVRLTAEAAGGLTVSPHETEVVVQRGSVRIVELTVAAAPNATSGRHKLTLTASGRGQVVVAKVAIDVYPKVGGTNIALGMPATASGLEPGTGFVAANAVDGDRVTRWSSGFDERSWLTVDLGRSTRVGAATLRWEAAYAKAYEIQVSDDGTTWTTLATAGDGRGGDEMLRFDGTGRYIRWQGVTRGPNLSYSLYEFELFAVSDTKS